ncbi:putative aspartic proteinase [Rosellinia necatrix]|uniref:Putative aspartic proteinase n=1 Tax=Rosellinia necatrix TaxID=77044 RepID=A0A1W2TU62_ROSNE|nr:putative aspartic proteinase [Rosellinia necatrix]
MRNLVDLVTGSLLASVATAQVVRWDIEKRSDLPSLSRRLRPRADGSVEEVITNERTRGGYFASCSVGTPSQKVTLQLDTGSSDIWVPASSASVCEQQTSSGGGCSLGSYDPNASSTGVVVDENFEIAYVDNSYSRGVYIAETFGIGDVELQNMTMGLGLDTDIAYGLVGVGYALNEAADQVYDNLPIVMQKEGHIQTNAYSLWLNDLDASKGNILFGGVDTDKYMGDLTRVNVEKDAQSGRFTSFTVKLTSLEAHSSSGEDALSSTEFPVPVVLDSGTTLSYLPQDLAEQVWQEVGAQYYEEAGAPLLPCSLAGNDGYFVFGFGGTGGPAIKVSMDELVLPAFRDETPLPDGPYQGQAACQFGIQNTSSSAGSHFLLGDTFLRSAYVVYDLENNEIGMAATDFNATTSNIVPFPSQGAEIPSSTPAPNQDKDNSGPSSEPAYNARSGFAAQSSSDGGNSAGSMPPALDFAQMMVMGGSMGLMMFGGGMFLLF